MKVRTTVTLTPQTAGALSALGGNRSEHVEAAVVAYLRDIQRRERDDADMAIIERNAAELNAEIADALDFQATL